MSLQHFSVEQLLEREKDVQADIAEASGFNEDARGLQGYLEQIMEALEKKGVCRGGLQDGCEICTA